MEFGLEKQSHERHISRFAFLCFQTIDIAACKAPAQSPELPLAQDNTAQRTRAVGVTSKIHRLPHRMEPCHCATAAESLWHCIARNSGPRKYPRRLHRSL